MDKKVTVYGAIAVSVLVLGIFAGCLVIAYVTRDNSSIALLVGAAVSMATTAVGFWLGSSAGSQKKDDRPAVPSETVIAPPPRASSAAITDPAG